MIRDAERPADSLWLLAHDAGTGRPLLGPRVLGLGLAGALLAELLLGGLVRIDGGLVYDVGLQPYLRRVKHYARGLSIVGWCPLSYRPVNVADADTLCPRCLEPGVEDMPEPLMRRLLRDIGAERSPRRVADWLTVFSRDAPDLVTERLAQDAWLFRQPYRNLLGRRRERWLAAQYLEAEKPAWTLRQVVHGEHPADAHHRVVAGFVEALGLSHAIFGDAREARSAVAALQAQLSPPLQYLIEQTKTMADDAVIAHTG
ncbi:GOLPH3/VPS74 family protein [Dactylosporangium sp. CS-047395]|uniref:GOLPH3/VPS74 family protein n=1 Tax=Dactylosporangium sp. CS-047395 TaxID=3239936 RepID=UPI003D8BD1DE